MLFREKSTGRQSTHNRRRLRRALRTGIEALEDRRLLTTTPGLNWFENAELTASDDFAVNDHAGREVSISGDTIVVSSESDDDNGIDAGAAYVYVRNTSGTPSDPLDDTWQKQARLIGSDTVAGDHFGHAVEIQGDTLVIGAFQSDKAGGGDTGAAYVFQRAGATWTEVAKLRASDGISADQFGTEVAIDGDTIVVTAFQNLGSGNGNGAAYVFDKPSGGWSGELTETTKLVSTDFALGDRFGRGADVLGDTILIGADQRDTGSGRAYVFQRDDNGTPGDRADDQWVEEATLTSSDASTGDQFGHIVVLDGTRALITSIKDDVEGISNAGSATIFERNVNGTWTEIAKLKASDAGDSDQFGRGADIEGDTVVIGAWSGDIDVADSGSVYFFQRAANGQWTEQGEVSSQDANGDDRFGSSMIDLQGNTLVVGDSEHDHNGEQSGGAFVFVKTNSVLVVGDSFESGSFSGGLGPWSADGGWSTSGDATIRSDTSPASGSYHARLRRSSGDLQRTVDVTDLTDVRLQFAAKLISFESSDRADVKVSGDGTNWTTIQSFVNGQDDGVYHTYDLAVPDLGNTLYVRFDAGMSGSADYWFIDNVQVVGTPPSLPQITISDVTISEDGTTTFNDPTATTSDHFGRAVSIDDNRILIGDQRDDTLGTDIGQAHLFDAVTGNLLLTLNDPTPTGSDNFGHSVAIDGNLILIGSHLDDRAGAGDDVGQAYLFDATTGDLLQTFNDPDPQPGDQFGWVVALDGSNVLISAYQDDTMGVNVGQAHLFDAITGNLLHTFNDPTPTSGDEFGHFLAIKGSHIIIGAPTDDTNGTNVGQAHLFDVATGNLLRTFDNPSAASDDRFGHSVGVDGNNVLIGAFGDDTNGTNVGQAYLFDAVTGNLLQTYDDPTPTTTDQFSRELVIQGDHVLIGARLDDTAGANVGQVHLFDTLTGALLQTFDDPTVTLGDEFGRSVALDGNHVVVGAFKDSTLGSEVGQAHLFAYGAPQANFTVSLSSPSSEIVTVDFNTADGTAKVVDGDYTATSGTLTFAPGVTSRTILVPIMDDSYAELEESFSVNLSRAVGATITDAKGLGTIVDDDALASISYGDFSDSSGLNLLRDAAAPIGANNVLRVTPLVSSNLGLAWHTTPQLVSIGFETTFDFQVSGNGGAGFAFVIQNDSVDAVGGGGGGMGYKNIPNSLAIEFDTFLNGGVDTDNNHVSVQSLGTSPNSNDASATLGSITPSFDINDGNVHQVRVVYQPGTMEVYLDDLFSPAFVAPVDLVGLLNLDAGHAWLGFTGVSSSTAQSHDILNWHYSVLADSVVTIAIEDAEIIEGVSGTANMDFLVTRFGDRSGTSTVNWDTSDGTATTADNDYVAASGQFVFAAGDSQKTISITVNGDTSEESHEFFSITLSEAVGATVVDDVASGTILNDETTISISNESVTEGDTGMRFIDEFVTAPVAQLSESRGIEIGPDGNLYVSRHTDAAILKFDAVDGSSLGVFAADPQLGAAKNLEFGPDGNLYVSDNVNHSIVRFDGTTGAFIDVFVTAGSGGLNIPRGLTFDSNGNLFVSSATTDEILRFDGISGALIDSFVTAGSGGLNSPTALTFGSDGNLYVGSGAHSGDNSILRYDGTTGAFLNAFVSQGSAGLTIAPTGGVIFGPDMNNDGSQDLWVSNGNVDEVMVFDGVSGAYLETPVSAGLGGVDDPKGLVFDSTGNLFVVDNGNNRILRYGEASQVAFSVSLSSPSALPVSVDFATVDISSTSGSDYTGVNGTLMFAPGVTTQTLLVQTSDDAEIENDETFSVNLSTPVGATLLDATGIGTIVDDEIGNTPPVVNAGSDQTFSDTDGSGSEAVTLVGTASDGDGTIASLQWTEGTNVLGSSATLSSTLAVGVHTLTLTAIDNGGATGSDTVVVTVLEVPSEAVLFEDSFEVGSNSNDWNGKWVEDSQDDFLRSTQRSTDGVRSAEVDGRATNATLTTSTPIDISGYASAELTFDWLIEKGFDTGEYLSLDVSTNGGASWTQDVRQLRGNVDAENVWHNESVDLSAYNSSDLKIRFRSYVSSSREDANIDNVKIIGSGSAASAMAASMMAMTSLQSDDDRATEVPEYAPTQPVVMGTQPAFNGTTVDSVYTEMNGLELRAPQPSDSADTIELNSDLEAMLELFAGEQSGI